MNYYNEFDKKAAAWLRELISAGLISDGEVDERSITEVSPNELKHFTQCHFFAGIGGWSCALRMAGWPDNRLVWTASLPCQPFSSGGNSKGAGDDRHLWPVFSRLVKECKPHRIFGEQVARAVGFQWLDGVCADLEAQDYAVGSCVLGAHSAAAPHQRQRLFWTADSNRELDSGKGMPDEGRASSHSSIWASSQIIQEGQGRVDELVSRHITERVSSYSEARSILNGIPGYMALLRGAGNAIVPQVAAMFIEASQ